MADITSYQQRIEDIATRAAEMKRTLVEPFRIDNGGFLTPTNKAEADHRNMVLESAIGGTAYSTTENGKMVAAIHSRSLQGYESRHGCLPSDDLLASAHKATENALVLGKKGAPVGGVFESADMSTTDGILTRDRLVSLILPVMLQSVTSNMVTFIPGEFNQSEFMRLRRVAGSSFGNLTKGDVIDFRYNGLYAVMDQRIELGTGDGSTKQFAFNSKEKFGTEYPLKIHRLKIIADHVLVASDNGNGAIAGTFMHGGESVVVSGTVDYATGVVSATFSVAPTSEMPLHIGFDVDIEHAPSLIPRVDHRMDAKTLYPHESAIAGSATIQALWTLRRELGQDIDNLTMQGLRNMLAADKDRKHLHDMRFYARQTVEWVRTGSEALTLRDHYETLNAALLEMDSGLMNRNGVSGLVGLVAGTQATNIFRYLPAPLFVATPGYRNIAQPHYVGKVFGQWDLYCDPQAENAYSCLGYAKGPDHGQTAYVAGDAIPALTFRHPVLGELVQKGTMWDLAYRDMQPFDGEDYLAVLNMVE